MDILTSKRMRRLILSTGVIVALYGICGFLILPPLLKPVLEKQLAQFINGKVLIENMTANPFTLALGAKNIRLEDSRAETLAQIGSIAFNLQARTLIDGIPVFSIIEVTEPKISLGRHKDGELNFAHLIRSPSPPAAEEHNASSQGFMIEQLTISEGSLDYYDDQLQKRFEFDLAPLKIELLGFQGAENSEATFELSARNTENNTALVKGTLEASPFRISGSLDFQVNDPGPLFLYLTAGLNISSPSARIHVISDFIFDTNEKNAELAFQTSKFEIEDLKIPKLDDKGTAARIDKLSLGLDFSLKDRFLKISELKALGGETFFSQSPDGTLTIAGFQQTNSTAPEPPDSSDGGWKVSITSSRISDFAIHYTDQANDIIVHDLDVELDRFSTEKNGQISAKLKGSLEDSGSVKSVVTGALSPPDLTIDLAVEKLGLKTLSPFLDPLLKPAVNNGTGRLTGKLKISGSGTPLVTFTGAASVNDLVMQSQTDSAAVLMAKDLHAETIQYTSEPPQLSIDRLTMKAPELSLRFDKDGTGNVFEAPPSPPTADPSKEAEKKFVFKLNNLILDKGILHYRDETFPSPFRTRFSEISGNFSDISNATELKFKVNLTARIDGQGRLSYKGGMFPSSSFPLQDGELTLSDLDMLALSPYSMKFFGRPVEGGKLHAEIKSTVTGEIIEGENNFILDRFYLGKQSGESSSGLPIVSALSILRDDRGRVNLSFPLSGNVKTPGFSYRKLFYKSLEDIILSIVASPFSLIGSLYQFSSEELSHIDFEPGDYKLPNDQMVKIDLMRKALTERPGLRLELRGGSAIVADGGDAKDTTLDEKRFQLAADRASSIRDTILADSTIEPGRIYMLAPVATELSENKTIPSFLALRSD